MGKEESSLLPSPSGGGNEEVSPLLGIPETQLDLLLHGDPNSQPPPPLSSDLRTFANLVISIVGASVLGFPYAFSRVGWVGGAAIVLVTGAMSYYSMMLLVWSRRRLERDSSVTIRCYGDLGFHTFGHPGRAAVDCLVVISQAGFCVGYLLFITETLASMFSSGSGTGGNTNTGNNNAGLGLSITWSSKAVYAWILLPLEALLAMIRHVTHLAPFSILADVADVTAMVVVMGKDVVQIEMNGLSGVRAFNPSMVPFAVGVCVYSFIGTNTVIPIETAMRRSQRFGKVLGMAIAFIICLYASFGVLGYLAFKDETKQIVTLNIGNSLASQVIQSALCLGLSLTFPLMMNPVYEVLERRLFKRNFSVGVRGFLVFLTCLVTIYVPSFSTYLSLAGSTFCCLLGFIFPAAIHLKAFHKESTLLSMGLNCYLILFGLVFGVWGTITSITSTT